jgi:hypothetical protein
MSDENKGGLDWDSEIDPTVDRKPFVLLPEGAAKFVVLKIERKREEFGKLGVQNVAHVKLSVMSMVDEAIEPAEMTERLCLHQDMMWKITEFFTAIGQRKHGDKGKFVPDWAAAETDGGGFCEITHRKYTAEKGKNKGKEMVIANIAKYTAPDAEVEL